MTAARLAPVAKAIAAGLLAFLGAAATAAADERITSGEWWAIASATAVAGVGVWGIPNRPARPSSPSSSSPEGET